MNLLSLVILALAVGFAVVLTALAVCAAGYLP